MCLNLKRTHEYRNLHTHTHTQVSSYGTQEHLKIGGRETPWHKGLGFFWVGGAGVGERSLKVLRNIMTVNYVAESKVLGYFLLFSPLFWCNMGTNDLSSDLVGSQLIQLVQGCPANKELETHE